jgi:hypothetical protein
VEDEKEIKNTVFVTGGKSSLLCSAGIFTDLFLTVMWETGHSLDEHAYLTQEFQAKS